MKIIAITPCENDYLCRVETDDGDTITLTFKEQPDVKKIEAALAAMPAKADEPKQQPAVELTVDSAISFLSEKYAAIKDAEKPTKEEQKLIAFVKEPVKPVEEKPIDEVKK
jgi:hypothetical protein